MKQKILDAINEMGGRWVSFADLSRMVDGFKGDRELFIVDYNLVIWSGMSQKATEAIKDLLFENKILKATPTTWLTYLADGETLAYISMSLLTGMPSKNLNPWCVQ